MKNSELNNTGTVRADPAGDFGLPAAISMKTTNTLDEAAAEGIRASELVSVATKAKVNPQGGKNAATVKADDFFGDVTVNDDNTADFNPANSVSANVSGDDGGYDDDIFNAFAVSGGFGGDDVAAVGVAGNIDDAVYTGTAAVADNTAYVGNDVIFSLEDAADNFALGAEYDDTAAPANNNDVNGNKPPLDITGGWTGAVTAPEEPRPVLAHVYEILSEVGKGRGGVVYKARNTRIDKIVAIKKVLSTAKKVRDSKDEAMLLRDIEHSYLPRVYDYFVEDGENYTVTNFIEGETLTKHLKKHAVLPYKSVLKIILQLTAAVRYLHTKTPPIIHNDIKPDNIMMSSGGNICLIDFNASSVFVDDARAVGATKGYAAPELFGLHRKSAVPDRNAKYSKSEAKINSRFAPAAKTVKNAKAVTAAVTETAENKASAATRGSRYGVTSATVPAPGIGENDNPAASVQDNFKTGWLETPADDTENYNADFIVHAAEQQPVTTSELTLDPAGTSAKTAAVPPPGSVFFKGEHKFDRRSDVYSVGAVLYRLVTGIPPDNDYEKIVPIHTFKRVRKSLRNIIAKAMALNPENRYQNADELLNALKTLDKQSGNSKNGIIAAVAAVVLMGGAGFGAYSYSGFLYSEHFNRLESEYRAALDTAAGYFSAGDYGNAVVSAETAARLFPDRTGARLETVRALYSAGRLGDCVDTAERAGAANYNSPAETAPGDLYRIYLVGGDAAFDLKKFDVSAKFYEKALTYVTDPAFETYGNFEEAEFGCYLNLAISYARAGQADRAAEVLNTAAAKFEAGVAPAVTETTVSATAASRDYVKLCIQLARGEIALANNDLAGAEKDARAVLDNADDGYLIYRGILLFDTVARRAPDGKASYKKATDVIEPLLVRVPVKYRLTADNILADEYALRAAAYNNNAKLYRKAAELYKAAFADERLRRTAMLNYVDIEYRLKVYNECITVLDELEKTLRSETFADDYSVYMLRSRALFARFVKTGNISDRNDALTAYDKAVTLYEIYKNNGKSDPEMDSLAATAGKYRVIDNAPSVSEDVSPLSAAVMAEISAPEFTEAPYPTGVPAPPPGEARDPDHT